MSEEEKDEQSKLGKLKQKKAGWGTIIVAGFGAITAVGDAVRSHYERQGDQEQAAKEAANRVAVDTSIQDTLKDRIPKLVQRIEDLEADGEARDEEAEERDREMFELRVMVEAQDRIIASMGGVSEEFRTMLMMEALESEAREEDQFVKIEDPPPTEEAGEVRIKEEAKKLVKKKRRKPKPKVEKREEVELEFVEPAPAYDVQQFQQQMQQQLPPLPALPKKAK